VAALNYASNASWFINAPAPIGNKRIRAMESFDEGEEGSVETRTEVGPSRNAAGFVTIPGGKTISFTIRETKGAQPEIDWEYLKDNEILFGLTKQIIGGRRRQYAECRVSTIAPTGDNAAELMFTVEIVALAQDRL
jgi:hypothetical protein